MVEKRVIALGTFDGLHAGHRAVIEKCIETAKQMGAKSAVYTFLENPRELFGCAPLRLMTPEEKQAALTEMGVDEVFQVHFTRELAALSPGEFIKLISDNYAPCALVAGEDYSFGKNAAGTSETLKRLCAEMGIGTYIVPLVKCGGEKISSTRIRNALIAGDRAELEKLARR